MSKNNNQPPRRVDWWLHKSDYECAYLGALGMSTRYIESKTDLTPGKISYRLKKASLKRMDYRNGTSPVAKTVLKFIRPLVLAELNSHLKNHG